MSTMTLQVRPPSVLRLSAGRLFRLEFRRSPMLWMVPLAAAVFWLDTYRGSMALPPFWGSRTLYLRQGMAFMDFAPFVVGAAAWAGGRDFRNGIAEQIAITPLPRWAGRLTAWLAATCWALAAFLGCVGTIYGITARQGATGTPTWWPVLVGAVGLAACTAVGIAAGVLIPSRFTAPMAAIVATLVLRQTLRSGGTFTLLSPMASPLWSLAAPKADAGFFFPYLPDLPLTQIVFLGGLTFAALGLLGLQPVCGGRGIRRAAAALTALGLAASLTAVGLVSGARGTDNGVVIPAIHNAASDRPSVFTPVCGNAAIPVCLHPGYKAYLPNITAAFDPLLREIAGLPGAPVRVTQVALRGRFPDLRTARVSGEPPVLEVAFNIGYEAIMWSGPDLPEPPCCSSTALWTSPARIADEVLPLVAATVIDGVIGHQTAAQQAVSAALLTAAGISQSSMSTFPDAESSPSGVAKPDAAAYAAGRGLAALSATARRAWLTAHLAALRAGTMSARQLP
ncbi:MAG: hypothetical protein ABI912_08430 [Actinomycetota bacterium]